MINWLLRPILALAGVIAAWMIATDSPNYGLVQAMITIILVVGLVGAAAFWPARWTEWLTGKTRQK
ncbi:ABC-type phosphate transport system auxiliary subunit [Rhodoligotrophos appendicifer]|uniref:hypothetical protein n=1 Tax=Rhodoligotrophos appendicifer TaxID=987056 RepID=UPI0011850398|nr:hypothetical protein [Rhodoligotrophos appendicifer]